MHLLTKLFRRAALLLAVLCMWAPGSAWAESYATVKSLSQPDARGRWVAVDASANAGRIRDGVRVPLEVGMALQVGDQVKTAQARVTVRVGRGEHITVSEGSDLTLGERSVIQRLGEVYYQVRDVFRVDYGTVQTAVEGTEFAIDGRDGPVRVAVTEGAVRVSSAGETVRVKRGQVVTVAQSVAPAAPIAMAKGARGSAMARAWTLGRPRMQLGVMAGGGLLGTELTADTRAFAAVRLLPGVNLVAETGLGSIAGLPGSRIPASLGMEMALGGISVGGSAQATLERRRLDCGGRRVMLHLGGSAHARAHLPLTRRLFLVGQGRAGHNGDGLEASVLAGVGMNL